MTPNPASSERFKALIVGSGVAGIEAAFALQDLAPDAVDVNVLSPAKYFEYRPLAVLEPFSDAPLPRYPVAGLVRDAGAELIVDSFKWLDPDARTVHTAGEQALAYDAVLLALGARLYAQIPYVITLNPSRLGAQLQTLVREVEDGRTKRVVFIVPTGRSWPLPIYELALLLAARARQTRAEVAITVVTGEATPLAALGAEVSRAVEGALEGSGVRVITGTSGQVHKPHCVSLSAMPTELYADRVITLPELCGASVPGVPTSARRGFVSVDRHSRVTGLDRVFAAGDMTDHAIKHGGLAAQQADAAAAQIAVLAGAQEHAAPSADVLYGILLGPAHPLYIRTRIISGSAMESEVSGHPLWEHPHKLSARYLEPALAAVDTLATAPHPLAAVANALATVPPLV